MKRFQWLMVIVCIGFVCAGGATRPVSALDLIYLTEQYPPHNYMERGELKGLSIEILQLIWKKLDMKNSVEDIKVIPWARGMERIKSEPNIVLFGMGWSPDRLEFLNWIGPYYAHSLYLIAKKERKIRIAQLKDAEAYLVGAVRSDIGHGVLESKGFPMSSVDLNNSQNALFKKLDSGRVDMICYMEEAAFKSMPRNGLNPGDYEKVFEVFQLKSGYGFSKQVPKEFLDAFQGALNELVEEGRTTQILKKYKVIE